ncbi:MAG: MFS transporter [Anaerolineales bacterium]|nr:MFS transporter [Anaerolineales bacterium]
MATSSPAVAPQATQIFRLGALYYLINFLGAGAYMPYLYVYLAELGITGQQIGWLSVLGPVMMLGLATPIAALADRRRWRVAILQIALAGQAATLFLLGQARTFGWIALLMLLMAIAGSPLMSVSDSLIARAARRHNLNFGSMRLWGSLGYAASALAFGGLWQWFGFQPMFIVAPLFVLPVIWLGGQFEELPASAPSERQPAADLLRDPGLVSLLVATFLASISNSLAMTFGGIYARALGGGDLLIGMMIACAATAEILTMFLGERLMRRLRGVPAMILAYGLMAGAYLGWVLVPDPNAVVFFSIFKGLGYGLWFTVTVRLVTERTPEARAATAQSLLAVSMFGLAPLVAGPVGGWIHDAFNAGAVFSLGILALGLGAAGLLLASRRGELA